VTLVVNTADPLTVARANSKQELDRMQAQAKQQLANLEEQAAERQRKMEADAAAAHRARMVTSAGRLPAGGYPKTLATAVKAKAEPKPRGSVALAAKGKGKGKGTPVKAEPWMFQASWKPGMPIPQESLATADGEALVPKRSGVDPKAIAAEIASGSASRNIQASTSRPRCGAVLQEWLPKFGKAKPAQVVKVGKGTPSDWAREDMAAKAAVTKAFSQIDLSLGIVFVGIFYL